MSFDELIVQNKRVRVMNVDGVNYISLTDLARYVDAEEPRFPIMSWMRSKDVIMYLGLWEEINNINFNRVEFDTVKNESGSNKFRISPNKWINNTNAIGMISKSGKYNSGTFAHPDIAFEFASWLSPEFKLYLIKEFERLKEKELKDNNLEWNIARLFTKIGYSIQTDSINRYLIPTLSEEQKKTIYASEADVINVALFGMTAGEWENRNKGLSTKGNIRDYASIIELIILNNLEVANSELIKLGINQRDRLIKLNESARNHINVIINNNHLNNNYLSDK